MAIPPDHRDDYETLLSLCADHQGVVNLLQGYRPYLETLPSLRRPQDSMVILPLPNIRRSAPPEATASRGGTMVSLPCDLAVIMCDPEWQIATETEIVVFIHRPLEDFSQLLSRWRQTEILLDQSYEWIMPPAYNHLIGTGSGRGSPLFVVFPATPARIARGLEATGLPTLRLPLPAGASDRAWPDPLAFEQREPDRLGDSHQDG
ncbi:MAG: hypothetical protein KGQ93_09430 [Cyanobacteria bacterium REEB459]|nr:hypothetical protein [Cyanobacteria bacterium REEB459]